MLDVLGSHYRNCDGLSRREVLRVGSLAVGGVALPGLLRRKAEAAARSSGPVTETAVIQIFMGGGPSHIDMYDLKPDAPSELRGEFREIPTNVPGIRISEHLPYQARVMDRLAIVRSVMHTNSVHLPSSHLVLTGYEPPAAAGGAIPDNLNPFTGSIVAKFRGANRPGFPPFVAVRKRVSYGGPAYLGAAYKGFEPGRDPNEPDFHVPDLTRLPNLSRERLEDRAGLRHELDQMRRLADSQAEARALDRYSHQALDLLTNDRVAEAFDIEREDPRTRERYGRTQIGQNCLLARRLVEAGVTYVSCLSGGGWDTHADNFSGLKDIALPRYDRAVATLVDDIYERGLAERVLVMAFGEFGRTPRINKDAGRDHWPGAMCVLFSGGGLKVGQMVGATDAHGAYPTTTPYSPGSVLATMYKIMGIDPSIALRDRSGRPLPVLPEGRPIRELF